MDTARKTDRHKTAPKGRKGNAGKKRRRGWRKAFIWVSVFVVVCVVLVAIAFPTVANRATATARVNIPRDCTPAMLSDTLTKYFGAGYAEDVCRLVKLSGRDLASRHGSYVVEEGMPAIKAQRLITHGAQTPVRLTINGFRSFDELCARTARKFDFTAEELKNAATDPALLGKYGLTPASAMALWLDDTYEFYWTDTPQHIIEKIGENYKRLWNEDNVAKATAMHRTPAEIMILASIADEETNQASEKGRIGRLYNNRLDKGMRLQADPTVRFALGDFTIKRVRGEHLKVNSPYNTYLHGGLPPGPIRTTGKGTVQAILDSSPSGEIYMCAKEDFSGFHNFATDYNEHLDNAARYRKALDARGIE